MIYNLHNAQETYHCPKNRQFVHLQILGFELVLGFGPIYDGKYSQIRLKNINRKYEYTTHALPLFFDVPFFHQESAFRLFEMRLKTLPKNNAVLCVFPCSTAIVCYLETLNSLQTPGEFKRQNSNIKTSNFQFNYIEGFRPSNTAVLINK